jgi:hypothetical protein
LCYSWWVVIHPATMINPTTEKLIAAYFEGGNALGITTPAVLTQLMLAIKNVCEGEEKEKAA